MHKLDSNQENEIHKILSDFKIPADHQFRARRPDLLIDKKKITDHRVKIKESGKMDMYFHLAKELKKLVEHDDNGDSNWS